MASFQDTIRTFIQNKLNDTTNNPLVASGTTFKLYNRYEIEEQDFFDFVVNSVNWEEEEPFVSPYEGFTFNSDYATLAELNEAGEEAQVPGVIYYLEFGSPFNYLTYNEQTTNYDGIDNDELFNQSALVENNVVIEYDGVQYNTQLGQYTLDKVAYIPGIIENFMAEFEPLKFIRNVSYTLPITFYINETFNRELDNKIIDAVEVFQDKIRGNIELVYNHNVLFNHTDITPLTGIIDFNGTIFREYQMVVYMDAIKQVLPSDTAYTFFGNQIEYRMSIPTLNSGAQFRIYPISAMAVRSNELHIFQKFCTSTNNEFDIKAIPNESGLSLELAVFYTGDSFSKFLYQQKYSQTELPIVTLEVRYPVQPGDTQIPMEREYLIESIGGTETVGDKIIFTLMLRPVSEVY